MKKILVVLTLGICLLITAKSSYAQNALSILVAPSRQQLSANPGETINFNVRFYNSTNDPVTGTFKIADFIVRDSSGSPTIIEDQAQTSPKYSASLWSKRNSEPMTISKQGTVTKQVTLSVPKDAKPGGRYLAVFFEPLVSQNGKVTQQKEAAIGTTNRIVSLVYIRVKGPITEKASIMQFFTKAFSEYGPITLSTSITNNGDYHINPKGIISVENMLGMPVQQVLLKDQNIFPEATLLYTNELGSKWMLGRYKATVTASYGEQGQALMRSTYFWVMPWKVISAIILAILIVLFALKYFFHDLRGKHKLLETEVQQEKEEIEKLKEELKRKN